MLATNDIVIRNAIPTHALRFKISINGKQIKDEFIGDGIVVATTFGSTAYFESITRKKFNKGIGVAFNNTTVKQPPLFLNENAKIKVKITRGEAFLAADNEPKMAMLTAGKSVTITASKKKTKLITF